MSLFSESYLARLKDQALFHQVIRARLMVHHASDQATADERRPALEQIERCWKARNNPPPQVVYFITNGKIVKIGIARNPAKRRSGLQVATPERLTLIGTMEGGRAKELELHAKFSRYRIGGEWFRYGGWLRRFVQRQFGVAAP